MSDRRPTPKHELRPATPTLDAHRPARRATSTLRSPGTSEFTPLELLDKRQDDLGLRRLARPAGSVDKPFILVLAQFLPETDPFKGYPQEVLAPFAHLGIELPTREALDEAAARGPRRPAAWRCRRSRCRRRSATSACCATPTAT